MTEILTVSGVSQILHMPEQTVRALERRGKLTARRDSSGRRIFERADVERFARERKAEARTDADLKAAG